jgi:beta-glucosidase
MKTKDYRLKFTEKAKDIVDSLSLEEKVSLMGGDVKIEELIKRMSEDENAHYNNTPYSAGGILDKGVAPMLFCDGPRGVVCDRGKATCFPVTMLRGASFDAGLEYRIGRAIGKEVKAFGGNLFAGVCVNLPYNPGWGRSQETYGEESFHISEMAKSLIIGVQEIGVMACVKHYAFNQMEISRFKVNVDCDKRTEREVFLPHFKKCVDAGVASIMSSYNLYKGVHCGHHDYLLNKVLKEEWGFDGFIMSDFGWGIRDTVEAANGGQNIEMAGTVFFGDKLVKAVKDRLVPESKIDDAALRIIRTILAHTAIHTDLCGTDTLACKEHIALALESARKGLTLIKNKNKTLPFAKENLQKLVVLGKLGDTANVGDYGSSRVYPPYTITPLQGIAKNFAGTEIIYYDSADIEHAKELARQGDAVVFVVGYNHDDEGEYVSSDEVENYIGSEGGDRVKSLGLHEDEIKLIKEVGSLNSNSVAVLIGGNMIMIEEWQDYVGAILMAYYPGMEGGTAIAEILSGDVNPSGKLPFVIPHKETDLPQVNWNTMSQWYDYYHGYAKLEKEGVEPACHYGFGLSYTDFKVSNANFQREGDNLKAVCTVTNTGSVQGDEVVQFYAGYKNSKIDRPVKLLRGFTRVSLLPGESKSAEITCPIDELRYYDPEKEMFVLEAMDYELYIGTSSDDKDLLKSSISIGGNQDE